VELPRSSLGDAAEYLAEGVTLSVLSFGNEVLTARLPEFVEVEVANSGPSIKNERTDGKQLKTAVLANGAALQVPSHPQPFSVTQPRAEAPFLIRCPGTSRTGTSWL